MTDFLLLEKIHKMIVEIPKPRLLHRKGICARGFFRPYMSFEEYTEAELFRNSGESTPVTVRFSAMLGDGGTADTRRNIKGMAVKFHCAEKECDLICHSLPVFFINDTKYILKLAEAFTRRNAFDGINSRTLWQLAVENPESVNCILRLFSHEGLVDSFIYSKWHSTDTYIWKNINEKKLMVRYRWVPVLEYKEEYELGRRSMSRVSGEFMAGFDPDKAHEELEEAVMNGRFPSFELQAQIMDCNDKANSDYLKRTLCWDESVNKPVSIGLMKITETFNEENSSEKYLCFAPGNTIKGIDLCRDEISNVIDYVYKISAAERGCGL